MNKMKKLVITMMMLVMVLLPIEAKAATHETDALKLDVNNYGMAVLTVKADDLTYQLTKAMVVAEGFIDEATDTVYLRFKDGSLYWCCPQYQEEVKLQLLDKDVVALNLDNGKLYGYTKTDGITENLLSEMEVKQLVEASQSESRTEDNKDVDQPQQVEDNNIEDTSKVGDSNDDDKHDNSESQNNTTIIESNGSNSSSVDINNDSDVNVVNKGSDNTTKVENSTSGKKDVENNVVVDNQGDNNNTSVSNKTDSASKGPNVNVVNNGNGNTTNIVNNITTVTTTTKNKKIVRNYRSVPKGSYRELRNSKGKSVDRFKLVKKKLVYHSITIKNVKTAEFNSKGNVVVITKKGKVIVINYTTLKKKTIAKSGMTKLGRTKLGIAKWSYRKNGTRINVSKK